MSFSLIPPRVPEKKGLGRQTDGQESDPIRVPFFPFETDGHDETIRVSFLPFWLRTLKMELFQDSPNEDFEKFYNVCETPPF
ncbi:hypothetical protein EVAR_48506_1 [Eumeta japonica]|uniref:Uncharacterized protein n=1 Tax=Eumeta variegata TaxID=151549 RepID=A0A4C1XGM5_EUMVA|nr:hypothetical protein EVAR_48506_1 [Eumeta japonica]